MNHTDDRKKNAADDRTVCTGTARTAISGRTAVYGLLGHPVAHTFSPLIHNTLAELTGENLVYEAFDAAAAEDVEAAVKGAFALNIQGLNVTVPYKQAVIPYLESLDPAAEKIGAVNTLVRTEHGYRGYNTDYTGLKKALERNNASVTGEDVVLIGAGGAARAAAFLCGFDRAKSLTILNRTPAHAQSLADAVSASFPELPVRVHALSEAGRLEGTGYIAIQCTKAGLAPDTESTPVADERFFKKVKFAYDAIYNPEDTLFLRMVREAGGRGACGIEMLLYQALAAYELWTGTRPDENAAEAVKQALRNYLHPRQC